MESPIPLRLRFRIFQATSKLYADLLWSQALYHLQWALFHHFVILPGVVVFANNHYWALFQILAAPLQTLYAERSDLKTAIRKATDYAITIILWAIINATLHRETSPLKVPFFVTSINWLFSNPMFSVLYYVVFAQLFTTPVSAFLVIRNLGHARSFVRLVFWWPVRVFYKVLFFSVMEAILEMRYGVMGFFILSIARLIKWQFYLHCLWGLYIVSLSF
jgi:hypothetical protein